MKPHFLSTVVFALVLGIVSPAPLAHATPVATVTTMPFVDIPLDYDFKDAVQFLKDTKIVKGYPDQTYKPDALVTRAEFLKMALKLSGRTVDPTVLAKMKSPFRDVTSGDWFYTDILTGNKLGVALGYGHGTFGPNDTMTRTQALKLAFLTLQLEPMKASELSPVGQIQSPLPPDITPSAWFYPYAMTARKLFIMTDSDDGNFYPNVGINRGMAAEILFRISQVKTNGGAAFDLSREWNVFQAPTLGITFKMPKTWSIATDGGRVTVWKKDSLFPLDHELVTPLTANITFKSPVPETASSAGAFFEKVKSLSSQAYPGKTIEYTQVMIGERPVLHVKLAIEGIENWYVYLAGGVVGQQAMSMSVYGQYGMGSLMPKLKETLRTMVRTLVISPVTSSQNAAVDEALRGSIQSKILIENVGKSTINSLGDGVILLTDEIGVGTGAVDYYYSAKIQMTLKYERASDTILGVRNGKMTSF